LLQHDRSIFRNVVLRANARFLIIITTQMVINMCIYNK
jgi:hypothetical protein